MCNVREGAVGIKLNVTPSGAELSRQNAWVALHNHFFDFTKPTNYTVMSKLKSTTKTSLLIIVPSNYYDF